jgi:hypothetical protein
VQPGGVYVLEQALPSTHNDGSDPEAELVDQVVAHERVVEAAGADSISLRIVVLLLRVVDR